MRREASTEWWSSRSGLPSIGKHVAGGLAQAASPDRGDVGAAWHRVQSLGKCRRMSSEAVAGAVGQHGASEPDKSGRGGETYPNTPG